MLQKKNRFQVPKLVRWQYKLETSETLKVHVSVIRQFGSHESFYAKMQKSGRITIPKITLALPKNDKPTLEGYPIEVTLEPA